MTFIFLILSFIIIFFRLTIRNRKLLIKSIKICVNIIFSPFKLISFLFKKYNKQQEIKNKLINKENLKKQKLEMKIKLLKNNLNNN